MRLDLSTVIGISAALVAVFLSMVNFPYIDMSKIVVFWDPPALLIVFGGGVGSWMACFPFSDIKLTPKVVLKAWFAKDEDPCALIKRMVEFAEIARRDGILALENVTSTIQDPFLVTGIQLAVDGTDPELIEDILETEMHGMEERHMVGKRLIDIFIRNPFDFDAEYAAADCFDLIANVPWRVLRLDALIDMKLAVGRPVDLDDVAHLQALKTMHPGARQP